MALVAGGSSSKKKKTYKDWSAAVSNDKKLIDLAKAAAKRLNNSNTKEPPRKTGTRPKSLGQHLSAKPNPKVKPNLFGTTIAGMNAAAQGKKFVPPKTYGGKGTSNGQVGTTNSKGITSPLTERVGSTNAPAKSTAPAGAPYKVGKGIANSPAMKPAPKAGAKPYQAPKAPVVASGARAPQPPTVNGRPVSASNPVPQKAAPAKAPAKTAAPTKGGYWDQFYNDAKKSVEAQNLPALNEIQRAMDEISKRAQRAAGDLSEQGKREQANLGIIYERLGNYQKQIMGAQDQNYDALRSSAGGVYDKLAASLGQTFDGAQAAAQGEADRLGIGHTAPVNAGSERDQAFLTGLAGVDRAALMGGFDQMEGGFDQVMAHSRANAGSEGAMRQAVAMRENNKSLADLQFEFQNELTNLSGKRGDIYATQGQKTTELARVMEEQRYAREQEAKQIAFQQEMARKNYGLQERQVNASLAPQAPAPPSYYEQLQAAELEQRIRANQAAQDAMIQGIRAPERNAVAPVPRWMQPYPSPNAVDAYGKGGSRGY